MGLIHLFYGLINFGSQEFIISNAQYYSNKYNFLFDQWIGLKFYQKFSKILLYIELKFQRNQTLERLCSKVQKLLYENYINFLIDLEYIFLYFIQSSFIIFSTLIGMFLPIINSFIQLIFNFFLQILISTIIIMCKKFCSCFLALH